MAVRFDTAADRLTHNGTYPQTSAGFTYTAWIKIKVDRNDYSTWLRLNSSGNTIATLGTDSDGLQGANYFTVAGSALTTTAISIDTWVPVAGSRNASTGAINTFYRPTGSGTTLTGTSPITTSDVTGTPDQICIGGRGSADANEWFNGEVAYVRIWSAQLTQTEIESEWASATPVRTSNLHSNWPLADATDLTDTVGSKTLSLNGGAITTTTGPALGGSQAIDGVASAASRMSAGLALSRPLGGYSASATHSVAQRGHNLCPNPAADVDLTGWAGALVTVPGTNNQTANVIRATGVSGLPKTTGFRYQNNGYARSAPALVTAGQQYTMSWWGYQTYGSLAFSTSYIVWYNSSGGDISYENLGSFSLVGDGASGRRSATSTAPVGAVAMGLIQDGGVDCIISAVMVEPTTAAGPYADGDSPGWVWTGTPGLSASTSGPFQVSRPFDASSYASSSMTAPLAVSRPMAAVSYGATDFSGVLGVLRPIVGNASAATGVSLSNFIRLRSLSGSADASSLAYGDELFINSGPVVNVVVGGYLSNLLDRGLELVTVYPEEVTFDSDGNTWTRAASQGIDTMATIQVAAASGTSSRRAEQDNEGFEVEENWRLRFPRQFPYILGAQSKVRWRGLMYSVVGDAKRYNGSRRTAHVEYTIRRS